MPAVTRQMRPHILLAAGVLAAVLLPVSSRAVHAQTAGRMQVIFYNTENFFDCFHDSLKNDHEFLPTGRRHWTWTRMEYKAERIAKVLAAAGGMNTPALIGLCEVENRGCLSLLCRKMPDYHYKILHSESPDARGIDVALLYDPAQFAITDSAFLRVGDGTDLRTRDILYASGATADGGTLHVFVCHLPSMLGGAKATEWKRQTAKNMLRQRTDSILQQDWQARIIIMGDMNCPPKDDIAGMHNRMTDLQKKGIGTEKYKGRWTCLDQFYVSCAVDSVCEAAVFSPSWLSEQDEKHTGTRPKRTFKGFRYNQDGYSDHYPVILLFR